MKKLSRPQALFLLIAGLVMGTVFCVLVPFASAPVAREDAVSAQAEFASFDARYGRHSSVKEVTLRFADGGSAEIRGACVTKDVLEKLNALQPGAALTMALHPRGNAILALSAANDPILSFEDAAARLKTDVTGFFLLGVFMYFCAALGAFGLRRGRGKRRKKTGGVQ